MLIFMHMYQCTYVIQHNTINTTINTMRWIQYIKYNTTLNTVRRNAIQYTITQLYPTQYNTLHTYILLNCDCTLAYMEVISEGPGFKNRLSYRGLSWWKDHSTPCQNWITPGSGDMHIFIFFYCALGQGCDFESKWDKLSCSDESRLKTINIHTYMHTYLLFNFDALAGKWFRIEMWHVGPLDATAGIGSPWLWFIRSQCGRSAEGANGVIFTGIPWVETIFWSGFAKLRQRHAVFQVKYCNSMLVSLVKGADRLMLQ